MKNRIVALALALVMVLSVAVASAATIPGNVKDIADLPAVPTVPTMKVKANDHTATITLSQEVDYVNAYWAWTPTAVEMNGTTGTYRVDSHKFQVGMGTWGSNSKKTYAGQLVDKNGIPVVISGRDAYGVNPNVPEAMVDGESDIVMVWKEEYEAYKKGQIKDYPKTHDSETTFVETNPNNYGYGPNHNATYGIIVDPEVYGSHFIEWVDDDATPNTPNDCETVTTVETQYDDDVPYKYETWQHKPVGAIVPDGMGGWVAGQRTQKKASSYYWSTGKAYWGQAYYGQFGTSEMGFAYDLQYTDENGNQVYVRYDRFGNPVQIELSVYGGYDPFVGENPASCTKITWVVIIKGSQHKRVWIVDNIKVNYDEGDVASITGVYRHPKKSYTGKLVDYSVESR